jgi:hypothetical protein
MTAEEAAAILFFILQLNSNLLKEKEYKIGSKTSRKCFAQAHLL